MVPITIAVVTIAIAIIPIAVVAIAVPGTAVRVAGPTASSPTPTEPPPQPKAEVQVSIIWVIAIRIIRGGEVIIDWLGSSKNRGITRVRGSGSDQLCLCWRCGSRLSLRRFRRAGRRLCWCRRAWLCVHQRDQDVRRQPLRAKVDDLGGSQANARGVVNELDDDVLFHLGAGEPEDIGHYRRCGGRCGLT